MNVNEVVLLLFQSLSWSVRCTVMRKCILKTMHREN